MGAVYPAAPARNSMKKELNKYTPQKKISPVFYVLCKQAEEADKQAADWWLIARKTKDTYEKRIAEVYTEKYDNKSTELYIQAAKLLE
jgi:hypothetical protein